MSCSEKLLIAYCSLINDSQTTNFLVFLLFSILVKACFRTIAPPIEQLLDLHFFVYVFSSLLRASCVKYTLKVGEGSFNCILAYSMGLWDCHNEKGTSNWDHHFFWSKPWCWGRVVSHWLKGLVSTLPAHLSKCPGARHRTPHCAWWL